MFAGVMVDDDEVITVNVNQARVISLDELIAKIKAAGGSLSVSVASSDYGVAVANNGKVLIEREPNGMYRLTLPGGMGKGVYILLGLLVLGLIARR